MTGNYRIRSLRVGELYLPHGGGIMRDPIHVWLTHLHFDHADNPALFPGACVIVQRADLAAAIDPVPSQRIYYWKSTCPQRGPRAKP